MHGRRVFEKLELDRVRLGDGEFVGALVLLCFVDDLHDASGDDGSRIEAFGVAVAKADAGALGLFGGVAVRVAAARVTHRVGVRA